MITDTQIHQQESPSGLSTKERDETYQGVVHIDGNWRVIVCKDKIQWIIQRGKKAGTERRWYGVSYVTTRKSLMALWTEKTGASAHVLSNISAPFYGVRK